MNTSIVIPSDLHSRVKDVARKERRSVSSLICIILEKHLGLNEKEGFNE